MNIIALVLYKWPVKRISQLYRTFFLFQKDSNGLIVRFNPILYYLHKWNNLKENFETFKVNTKLCKNRRNENVGV